VSEPSEWTEQTVHVVEPTLSSEAGHCLSLVRSLCESAPSLAFELWVGRGARLPSLERLGAGIHSYFFRQARKLQLLPLYRKLLPQPGRILVTTAGRVDLVMLDLAAPRGIPPRKVFLYFHWVRLTPSKQAYFRRIARKHPHLVILGTTPTVEKTFQDCGFAHTLVVPYPATMDRSVVPLGEAPFRHVMFAGAARADKGFGRVVDLVARFAQQGESIPVSVQISADHYDKYDAATRADIDRLRTIAYPPLVVRSQTLSEAEYAGLFAGGICLQPYDRGEFADRVSSVTLDAFTAGCPVITVSRTWMARAVDRFGAGIVVEEASAGALHEAIAQVIADYPRYQANARAGAEVLRRENSWGRLIERLSATG